VTPADQAAFVSLASLNRLHCNAAHRAAMVSMKSTGHPMASLVTSVPFAARGRPASLSLPF
jgi:hypothetical protein